MKFSLLKLKQIKYYANYGIMSKGFLRVKNFYGLRQGLPQKHSSDRIKSTVGNRTPSMEKFQNHLK